MSDRKHSLNETRTEDIKKIKLSADGDKQHGLSSVVAAHYNTLEELGLDARNQSRIVYLRNFNNWIKSMLINEFVEKYRNNGGIKEPITVLDMCCGKGGDLLKWKKNDLKYLVCTDLAEVSVNQCKSRYEEMKAKDFGSNIFGAEFLVADCTRMRLKDRYQDKEQLFDLVSCQFSFHYCFESLPQAECMIRNAAECLKTGGYFIGTIPNANDIVMRQRQTSGSSFGNNVFKINFNVDVDKEFPLFGAQYDFFLEGVVNCPEFLVHFPTFIELAKKYGLKLISKERFRDYYELKKSCGKSLLGKMKALETYPAFGGEKLQGNSEEYKHADEYMKDKNDMVIGTLSQSEWEAVSLYMIFGFIKE